MLAPLHAFGLETLAASIVPALAGLALFVLALTL